MQEATLTQIKDHFNLSTLEFMKEWKDFSDKDKLWWRIEVGKILENEKKTNT
jgi:hypothetical protein